ncbi:hypothetical protein BH11BAC1_BH11BAC1_07100 [soil metagenome]
MKEEEIKVANLKCSGCAASIKKALEKITGVSKAVVYLDADTVSVRYDENIKRETIIEKLHSLGYPEATEQNGLLLQLKSYASCMIGKVNNMTHTEG